MRRLPAEPPGGASSSPSSAVGGASGAEAGAPSRAPSRAPSLGASAVSKPGPTLRIGVLHAGQLFGEVGVMAAAPRKASVAAQLPSELLVISRIELMRFFFDCPELKRVLLEASAAYYPDDDELRRTWRYDDAWEHFKRGLGDCVSSEPAGARARVVQPASARHRPRCGVDVWDGVGALPSFSQPPSSVKAAVHEEAALDPTSKLYMWASEFLDPHVIEPMKEGLIVSYPKPEPPRGGFAAPKPPPPETAPPVGGFRRASNAGAPAVAMMSLLKGGGRGASGSSGAVQFKK